MKLTMIYPHLWKDMVKSAPDKKASSIVYGLHFLQVWPSLNIAYETLRQIQTDVCMEWIFKHDLGEHLNDLKIYYTAWSD